MELTATQELFLKEHLLVIPKKRGLAVDQEVAPPPKRGVVGWQTARVNATNQLRKLQTLAAKTRHPLAGALVKEIEAVLKHLATPLARQADVKAMMQFVSADAGVTDLEGVEVEGVNYGVRAALLRALQQLEGQLPP